MKAKLAIILGCLSIFAVPAQAALIGVSGPSSNLGGNAEIVTSASVGNVNDDAAYNEAQQGFDEQQGVTLAGNISVDGGFVAAGTKVDSHMIFLNSGPGNSTTRLGHLGVEWLFSGDILGVMSNSSGSMEVSSTPWLGALDVTYPAAAFNARGLEGSPTSCNVATYTNDCYSISGNALTLSMLVTEPGDWIRVVTRSDVPEPASIMLFALGLLGLFGARRKS